MSDDDRILTEKQVQEMTQLSHTALWRARNDGLLKASKIGRSVRYRESDVWAFIDRCAQDTP